MKRFSRNTQKVLNIYKKTCISVIVGLIFISSVCAVVWGLAIPAVSDDAISSARKAIGINSDKATNQGTLVVIDFSQPSFRKRLAIIDLESGRMSYHRVAHGKNSGGLYAKEFSDTIGSNMSSIGLFRIDEKYIGSHGPSLRLEGLDDDTNKNARERGIVIHSAEYVSIRSVLLNFSKGFRLGRSEGCFALSREGLDDLFARLTYPAHVFAFAGDR